MLQYLHLKASKFEVGESVDVKTGDSVRVGVVRAVVGNNYYEVEFRGGEVDSHVSARHMKAHQVDEKSETSVRREDSNSTRSSTFRSMYNRFTRTSVSSDSADVPGDTPQSASLPAIQKSLEHSGGHRIEGSSTVHPLPAIAASVPDTIKDEDEPATELESSTRELNENTSPSKKSRKKVKKRKLLSDVELLVLERIRQCNGRQQNNGHNMLLSRLDLSHLQLSAMPSQCEKVFFLRELSVRKNEFRDIEEIVRVFPNLVRLDAAYNCFLPAPESGDVESENNADVLSPEASIADHSDAQKDTMLSVTPFAALSDRHLRLTLLDLSGCHLRVLPDELAQQCHTLQTLVVRSNLLTSLPVWLQSFNQLFKLDCADNQIPLTTELCLLIEQMLPRLSDISFDRNPCIEDLAKDQQGHSTESNQHVGPKLRYLLQKKQMQQSKEVRAACINKSRDIRRRVLERQQALLLEDAFSEWSSS